MNNAELTRYWYDIPTDESPFIIGYDVLTKIWNCDKRRVRLILAELSEFDNGDGYILIRSSHYEGFFRTRNRTIIEEYRREVYNRAMNTLKPLKKIKRVLNRSEQITIDELLFGDGIEPLNFD